MPQCQWLDMRQLIDAAQKAGWSGYDLITIVSITFSEATLNSKGQAYTCSVNGTATGLLQFEPSTMQLYGIPEGTQYDPVQAYKSALTIKNGTATQKGQGFNAWSSYTSGKYLKFFPNVKRYITPTSGRFGAAGGGSTPEPSQYSGSNPFDPLTGLGSDITNALNGLWDNVQGFLVRMLWIVLGLVVVIIGVHILTSEGKTTTIIPSSNEIAGKDTSKTAEFEEAGAMA